MAEMVECTTRFSNGMEFEIFQENCLNCTRYRNDHCRILNRLYEAMFIPEVFPYSDLMDYKKYGGKHCKSFTKEPLASPHRHKKQINGQISLFGDTDDKVTT